MTEQHDGGGASNPTMTKVKICGLVNNRDVEYVSACGSDYAGFVMFYEKSKRNITVEKAKELMQALDDRIKKVAVVVSPEVDEIRELAAAGFDIIQIHGSLSDEAYASLTLPAWRAMNLNGKTMEESCKILQTFYRELETHPRFTGFVIDAGTPGSGAVCDWDALTRVPRPEGRTFVLAGGLRPENVKEAIALVNPDVVDTSSGVECEKAQHAASSKALAEHNKDSQKINQFIRSVRDGK